MYKFMRLVSILIAAVLILSACNLPASTPTEEANVVFTAAALTVQAQLTQSTTLNTPTLPPPPPATSTQAFPTLTIPTATKVVPPTPVCDQAQYVKDVSIPDGSVFAPGATFTKTWRLSNAGTCTWSGYTLVFDSGDVMNGTSPIAIGTVQPGQEVDLSVTLTAPSTAGSYRGYWRIRSASGVLIPVLGGTNGRSFFVDIKVVVASSGFDFHTRAADATWVSNAGVQSFPGTDTNSNGFAMYRNNQTLEDTSSPGKILETHPQWMSGGSPVNGYIAGLYSSYTVVAGEHFKARIGFLANCGSGSVKFQLNYKESGVIKTLSEWTDTCDGNMKDVDVDLSSIVGKTVQFALQVQAVSSADQDSAVWVSPRVAIP